MRLIDADALIPTQVHTVVVLKDGREQLESVLYAEQVDDAPTVEPASPWHRVEEELPKEAGEYIVAYHPCWWEDVKTSVTEIGIDTFRGKTSWAKRKFQRVTHWMEKPEPPKEEA